MFCCNFSRAFLFRESELTVPRDCCFSLWLFFFSLDLIQIEGYSATEAGAALLPLILLIFVLSRWSGGLVARYGAKLPLVIGPSLRRLASHYLWCRGSAEVIGLHSSQRFLVLGLGMAVSVAPLTTAVMNSVSQDHAGAASGINNAISRIAGLLAIAVLGFVLIAVFNRNLDVHLRTLSVPQDVQRQINSQRLKLAAIQTTNADAREAINLSFVTGYRTLLWVAVALSIAGSISAGVLVDDRVELVLPPPNAGI